MDNWTIGRAWIVGAGIVWLGLALVMASDPVPHRTVLSLLVGFLGLAVGVAWVVYSVSWLGVFAAWRRALVWLAVPLFPIVVGHALWTGWPLAVRVWLCESALRERTTPGPIDPFEHVDGHKAEPKRVGLFQVYEIWRKPDGVTVFTTAPGMYVEGGLLHAPDGHADQLGDRPIALRHLYGPWYRYAVRD
jgi:hypothetical protein